MGSTYASSSTPAQGTPFDNTTVGAAGLASTDVQSAIEEIKNQTVSLLNTGEVQNAANITVTTTDQQLTSIVTPAFPLGGTYMCWFEADFNSATSGLIVTIKFRSGAVDGRQLKFMPFAGGTLTAGSQRMPAGMSDRITVAAGGTIQVNASTSTGTATCANAQLMYMKVAP